MWQSSKLILEKANKYLVNLLNLNQWNNLDMSLIKNKSQCALIQLDIMELYPLIIILQNAIIICKTTRRNFG